VDTDYESLPIPKFSDAMKMSQIITSYCSILPVIASCRGGTHPLSTRRGSNLLRLSPLPLSDNTISEQWKLEFKNQYFCVVGQVEILISTFV
jgi:hypothetical protein